jgi:hypothetical protein
MRENLKSSNGWSIKGLEATGPDPDLKEKLMLFGQFVGDWAIIKARYLQSDGTWASFRGEVHFGWILGGTAVQDVWIGCPEGSEKLGLYGTTVRFYDSEIDAWRSTWLSPLRGYVQTFIARKIVDEIVLEEKNPRDCPTKWIFSDITPESFRWHAEESHDSGKTWMLTEEMHIIKVKEQKKA